MRFCEKFHVTPGHVRGIPYFHSGSQSDNLFGVDGVTVDLLKSKLLGASSGERRVMQRRVDSGERRERQRYRRSAVLGPAVIESGGTVFEGEVLNISTGGALVRIEQRFAPEDVFTISIDGSEPLRAVLMRHGNGNHGIAFREDPARIDKIISDLLTGKGSGKELRVHPRRLVMLGGSFHLDGHRVVCSIQNLSLGGMFVRSDEIVPLGTPFEIDIARFGTKRSRPVRIDPGGMGCVFVSEPDKIVQVIGHLLSDPKR